MFKKLITGVWVIIGILIWLDPNPAYKILAFKSTRGFFKPNKEE